MAERISYHGDSLAAPEIADAIERAVKPQQRSPIFWLIVSGVVLVAAIVLGKNLVLGLRPREMVLLTMTILISMLTLGTGRTNILFGLVHVVVFAVFLFTAFVP